MKVTFEIEFHVHHDVPEEEMKEFICDALLHWAKEHMELPGFDGAIGAVFTSATLFMDHEK